MIDLFPPEPDDDQADRGEGDRCTPELLRAYILDLGRYPTLQECKKRFGGILGPIFDGWELQRRGEYPTFPRGGKA